jgi:hypothetical protein
LRRPDASTTCIQNGFRIPRRYEKCGKRGEEGDESEIRELLAEEERLFQSESSEGSEAVVNAQRMVVYTPPAVTSADSYNVLKFYALDNDIGRSLLARIRHEPSIDRLGYSAGHSDLVQEYPFIPDEVSLVRNGVTHLVCTCT